MKRFLVTLLLMALMLTFTACKKEAAKAPTYTSSFTMYVNNTVSESGEITSSKLATAQRLVDTYLAIIESYDVLENVVDYAGVSLTVEQLQEMITGSPVNDTEVFTVCVTTEDPQLSKDIADAIIAVAPEAIARIIDGTNPKIVSAPRLPLQPDKTE